ncbi:MAG: hypothetical protein Q4G69_08135 [Planctomycetia bacterium]|nr:hypothetical protein [Planctomycetia bacterium]
MFKTGFRALLSLLLVLGIASSLSAQTKKKDQKDPLEAKRAESFLTQSGLLQKPDEMMKNWLLARIDEKQLEWDARYEKVKTDEDIAEYQKERIDYFLQQLGVMWSKKDPLNAKITGKIEKNGYRVEKILFESTPNFYVTGTLFLPLESKFKAPYPGVLVVCGHSFNGKGSDLYQRVCALGAINGLAMFIIDPIDQGERFQHMGANGKPTLSTVPAHNVVGGGSILLGRNTATFEIWDMMRGIDYLQSRSDIIPDKIGATGNSGGGTQTAYIMALDPRVQAAAPACYICNLFDNLMYIQGPQDAEQNIFGQIGFGMDHADYCIMRAPRPTMLCTASKDFFNIEDAWKSFRFAKRIYSRMGYGERMSLIETDENHGFTLRLREGSVRWLCRWLAGRDQAIFEDPAMEVLTDEEIRSISESSVIYLPKAKTTYDLNRDLAKDLAAKRKNLWKSITPEKARDMIRKTAGIRPLADIPQAKKLDRSAPNFKSDLILETDKEIYLPVRSNVKSGAKTITLFISDSGRRSAKADKLFADKDSVFAVDLRGWGETQAVGRKYYLYKWFGTDGSDYYMAYLLGKSYVGMRTEDLLSVARYLKETYNAKIELEAEGYAGTVALHAAIAEPDLFKKITIDESALPGWNTVVEQSPIAVPITDFIHGVLNYYDICDLTAFIKK